MNDSTNVENDSSKAIKNGALMSYLVIFVNIMATLIYTPWMIKQIGINNYGLYTLALSITTFFLVDFGMNSTITRFVSKYRAETNIKDANKIIGAALKIYLLLDIAALIILIVVFFYLPFIYGKLSYDELEKFKIVYLLVSIYCVMVFPFNSFDGILISYEKFFKLKLCELISKGFSIVLIIAALLWGYGLYALIIINIFTGTLGVLIKFFFIFTETPIKIKWLDVDKSIYKDIFDFSIWVAIISIAQRFIFNITPTILGMFSGAANIAIFGIASSLEGYFYTIASALNGMFLPKISRMLKEDNFEDNLLQLMIKVGRIQLIIIGYLFIAFCILGKDFIILWIGKDYIPSYYCAIFLIIPSLLYLPQQIANSAIMAKNKVNLQAKVFIIMAISNLIISTIFSKYYGALGASIAICIAYLIRCLGLNMIYHKELKIDLKKYFIECYGNILVSFSIVYVISILIESYINKISLANFAIKVVILLVIYSIVVWEISLNKNEKSIIKNFIRS